MTPGRHNRDLPSVKIPANFGRFGQGMPYSYRKVRRATSMHPCGWCRSARQFFWGVRLRRALPYGRLITLHFLCSTFCVALKVKYPPKNPGLPLTLSSNPHHWVQGACNRQQPYCSRQGPLSTGAQYSTIDETSIDVTDGRVPCHAIGAVRLCSSRPPRYASPQPAGQ